MQTHQPNMRIYELCVYSRKKQYFSNMTHLLQKLHWILYIYSIYIRRIVEQDIFHLFFRFVS